MSTPADPDPEKLPGYRRRIVIEPGNGVVTSELEDDYHRMVVTLEYDGEMITGVASQMPRGPWTTCDGAMAVVRDTFLGKRLDDMSVKRAKSLNCTHLYDLASFCAGHAGESERVTYEIFTSDPVDGLVVTRLYRNGAHLFDWTLKDGRFVSPEALAGKTLTGINEWLATLDPQTDEAARVLRWASMVAGGRGISMPTGMKGADIGIVGTCHTFQPGRIDEARRRPSASRDFSREAGPLADRAELFERD
ncbi:MAG: hypothetical protein KDE25_05640 [Novosphingobium sp.]|nr:hypothetical protein [Novosphingobium sp.]